MVVMGLFLLLGVVLGWRLRKLDIDDKVNHAFELLLGQVDVLTAEIVTKSTELTAALTQAADEHQRRVQVVEMIAVVERDREQWKKMYWDCGLGHSAAQDLLMRQILKLRMQVQRLGGKLPSDGHACDEAVDNFRKTHGQNGSRKSVGIAGGSGVANVPAESVVSVPK